MDSSLCDAALDALPAAVYICNRTGHITYFNAAAAALWGRRPDTGDPAPKYAVFPKIFVDGELLPPERTPMAVALSAGQPFREFRAVLERADGSRFEAVLNISLLYDESGCLQGAVNMFREINELHATHSKDLRMVAESLRKSEEHYHKMIEEVEDYAIFLLDSQGIVQNWNRGAEKIKGYREEEIVGRSFQEFYLPGDRQSGLPLKLLAEAREKGKAQHEGWRKRKDGSVFWASVVLTALHDGQGKTIGFSKVTRDLTSKKEAEDRIKDYLGKLEFQKEELEQFVYAASHDMKEPLRKILFYTSYIAGNELNVLDAKSRQYFNRSVEAAQRMTALIDDLLSYSRVSNPTDGFEDVDLRSVVGDIADFRREEFEQKRVKLETNPLPVVKGVRFQLNQLLSNLVDNAVKYKHPDRDSHIVVESQKVSGAAAGHSPDGSRQYHKITVTDNGIGFDQAQSKRMFEIFQRLPTEVAVKGTGIGLAICKKIVQNHHGFIEARGEPGEGAVFSIYLPAGK